MTSLRRLSLPLLLAAGGAIAGCNGSAAHETRGTAPAPPADESTASPAEKPEPAVEPAEKIAAPTSTEIVDIKWEEIEFPHEPNTPFAQDLLTAKIKELVGRRVRIRGYILSSDAQVGLDYFVLIRDNQFCCFGPGAKIYHNMQINLLPGTTTNFTRGIITLEGDFAINELINPFDRSWLSVFQLTNAAVK